MPDPLCALLSMCESVLDPVPVLSTRTLSLHRPDLARALLDIKSGCLAVRGEIDCFRCTGCPRNGIHSTCNPLYPGRRPHALKLFLHSPEEKPWQLDTTRIISLGNRPEALRETGTPGDGEGELQDWTGLWDRGCLRPHKTAATVALNRL